MGLLVISMPILHAMRGYISVITFGQGAEPGARAISRSAQTAVGFDHAREGLSHEGLLTKHSAPWRPTEHHLVNMSPLRQLCRCTGSFMLDGLYPRTARRAQPRLCNGQCHRPRPSLRFGPLALRFAFRLRHQSAFRWLNVASPLNRPGRQLQPSRTDVGSGVNSTRKVICRQPSRPTAGGPEGSMGCSESPTTVAKYTLVEHSARLGGVSVPRCYGTSRTLPVWALTRPSRSL